MTRFNRDDVRFAAIAGVLLTLMMAPRAYGAVSVTSSVAQFVTESGSVSRMYAALDPGNQIYLVVWSSFTEVTKGQFLNTSGRPVSSPFQIVPGASGYARVVRGANEFLVTYQRAGGQRWGRSVRYVNGSPEFGPEFFITNVYVDSDAGMAYVPSAGHYLVTSWNLGGGYRSYVTGVKADGTITIPTTWVTDSRSDAASPEIACDPSSNRCLMVGYGDAKYTWARFFNGATGNFESSLFTADSGSLQEDHNVEWNPTDQRYLLVYVRNRNGVAAKRLYSDMSVDPSAETVISGNYGQLGLSYNSGSNSFVATFKDGSANNIEYCWVQEFNGKGSVVAGQLMKVSTQSTAGNAGPVVVGNSQRSEYLFVQTRNYTFGDAGVLNATTPDNSGGSGGSSGGGTTTPPPTTPPPTTTTTSVTVAKADFNRDGGADLLWRRNDGAIAMWRMNGLTAAQQLSVNPASVDPVWRIAGTGDLDGDGRPEIIWQHKADGWLCAWFMNDETLRYSAYLDPNRILSNAWKIVAIADMNGDSKADLIWQHDSGWLAVWYMNGTTRIGDEYLTPDQVAGSDWRIVGAGDMNGDRKADLIWQHTSGGWLSAWLMNGSTLIDAVYLSPNHIDGPDWKIRGVIDLDGDGQTDLVWQHRTGGWLAAWLMNGTTATSTPYLGPNWVSTLWELVGPK